MIIQIRQSRKISKIHKDSMNQRMLQIGFVNSVIISLICSIYQVKYTMLLGGQYSSSDRNRYLPAAKVRMSKIQIMAKKVRMIEIKRYERKPFGNPIANLIKSTEKVLNVPHKDQLPNVSPKKSNNSLVNTYLEDKNTSVNSKQDQTNVMIPVGVRHRKAILANPDCIPVKKGSEDRNVGLHQSSLIQISKVSSFKQILYKTGQFANLERDNDKLKRIFPKKYLPKNRSFINRKLKDRSYEAEMMEYTNQSINLQKDGQSCLKLCQIRINQSQRQLKRRIYNYSSCSQKPMQVEGQIKQAEYISIEDDNISPW